MKFSNVVIASLSAASTIGFAAAGKPWAGQVKLKDHGGNMCMDADTGRKNNVYFSECHDGPNQQFYYDTSTQRISHNENDSECLDDRGMNKEVYMSTCHSDSNQKWELVSAGSGYYLLKGKKDNKCIDCGRQDWVFEGQEYDNDCYMLDCDKNNGNQLFRLPTYFSGTPAPTPNPTPNPTPYPTPLPTPSPTNPSPAPVTASTSGDPHFKTWNGSKFDFHGECDLVLVQNPNFMDGLGLNVHVRTKIDTWWSYNEAVAIQIGDNVLEVMGGQKQIPYWVNGEMTEDMPTMEASLGGFLVEFKRINEHQARVRIQLEKGNAISIDTYKRFIGVNFKVNNPKHFADSYGMMGSYPGGAMLGRDKATVLEDPIVFGQEWQVLVSEPKLFHRDSNVQHPDQCVMPDATKKSTKRRLGESMLSEEDAAAACSHALEEDRDACIFDVLATNDKGMAGTY